jgi:putative endonuclease
MYIVYVIYNKTVHKYYIGQTINIEKRLAEHNDKLFKGYTARFEGTWEVVYSEQFMSRGEALVREKQLKSYQGRKFLQQYIPT